jgi:hypothetical protein
MTTNRALAAALLVLCLIPAGCRGKTEEEALREAREEVRREMQPEIDRRQRKIEDLKKQVAEARARIESQKAGKEETPSRPITPGPVRTE